MDSSKHLSAIDLQTENRLKNYLGQCINRLREPGLTKGQLGKRKREALACVRKLRRFYKAVDNAKLRHEAELAGIPDTFKDESIGRLRKANCGDTKRSGQKSRPKKITPTGKDVGAFRVIRPKRRAR